MVLVVVVTATVVEVIASDRVDELVGGRVVEEVASVVGVVSLGATVVIGPEVVAAASVKRSSSEKQPPYEGGQRHQQKSQDCPQQYVAPKGRPSPGGVPTLHARSTAENQTTTGCIASWWSTETDIRFDIPQIGYRK